MSARQCVQVFYSHLRERVKDDCSPSWGRDMRIFRGLLASHPLDKVLTIVKLYFEKKERIYSVPFFKVQFPELLQHYNERPIKQQMVNREASRYDD